MKQPVQWCYDLTEVHVVAGVLSEALIHEDRLCDRKQRLRNARDKLADLIEAFEVEAMEVTHETEYLHLFDALSFLSDALRGPAVNPRTLQTALTELQGVFSVELEEEPSPAGL